MADFSLGGTPSIMISPELTDWIAKQSATLERAFPFDTPREEVLARMVKLTEEVGELADAVTAAFKRQRAEKQEEYEKDALADECADVLITTLLLAQRFDIDVSAALQKKIAKIDARFAQMISEK